ncbi:uncharacterized protein LOC108091212 [Drosophila ficusphila]|uniref:uncharacterized protein LOC108091212 n=1 Tax=Drosophila ficusphila TaxID=30025 RepID=UPI0007E60E66|nr:uncharacterized protein LOC108091212 [Drosophila ficusphila]
MPKFSPKRFISEVKPSARGDHTPNIAGFTNSRTLRSVYSANEMGSTTLRTKGIGGQPPRVWNSNKPRVAKVANKTYKVYAKQQTPLASKEGSRTIIRQWVDPPYPVPRPKKERNQYGGPPNYESFYVPFGQDKSSKAAGSSNKAFFVPLEDNRELPQLRLHQKHKQKVLAEVDAQWRRTEEEKMARKLCNLGFQTEPHCRAFQRLRPAGERFAGKIGEMVNLIAEVKSRRQKADAQMSVENVPLLPPPPQFAEDAKESRKRLLFQRSRTETLFSTLDCDSSQYKYACRLPYVRDPAHPDVIRPRLSRFSSTCPKSRKI